MSGSVPRRSLRYSIVTGPDAGAEVAPRADWFVLGRERSCDLVLTDASVSRRHASFKLLDGGGAVLHDLGSTNGTFVNGARVTAPIVIDGTEQLRFGDTILQPAADSVPTAPVEAPARPPGPATMERRILRRSVRRATVLGGAAAAVALALGVAVILLLLRSPAPLPPADRTPTVASVVAELKASVVLVTIHEGDRRIGNGSGVVIDAGKGLVLTNAHVVNAGSSFSVGIGGDERPASVVAVAPCDDLAVLRVQDAQGLKGAMLGSQSELQLGDAVVALGYPANASLSDQLTATSGVVSVVRTEFRLKGVEIPRYPNVIQTDAVINPGNSGGPLVTLDGKVVGVNTVIARRVGNEPIQGQGYAIGVDRVTAILPTLEQGRSIGWMGMGFDFPVRRSDLTRIGLPPVAGLIVSHVVPGTGAAAAGFGERPALVVAIDGTPVYNTLASYCRAAGGIQSGRSADVTVYFSGDSTKHHVRVRFD